MWCYHLVLLRTSGRPAVIAQVPIRIFEILIKPVRGRFLPHPLRLICYTDFLQFYATRTACELLIELRTRIEEINKLK